MIFSKIGPARPHDIVPHLFVIQVGTVNLLVALRTLSPGIQAARLFRKSYQHSWQEKGVAYDIDVDQFTQN